MFIYIILGMYLLGISYAYLKYLKIVNSIFPIFEKRVYKIVFSLVYLVISTSFVVAMLLYYTNFHKPLRIVGNYWVGFLQISLVVFVPLDIFMLVRKIFNRNFKFYTEKRSFNIAILGIILSLFGYGLVNSKNVRITEHTVSINKTLSFDDKEDGKNTLKIALISDTHLGYSYGEGQIQRMVDKINSQNVDLVILAGDIFDNSYDAVKNPDKIADVLATIKSRYGVYASWGNHDTTFPNFSKDENYEEKKNTQDKLFREFLNRSKIKILEDESRIIQNKLYLVGRKDYSIARSSVENRKEIAELIKDFDKKMPILVIDHQPRELQKASETGIDMIFSGHTHNGQIFPGNLINYLFWEHPYGVKKFENMYSFVTSGVGGFGAPMRLGSKSEVMIINVNFK